MADIYFTSDTHSYIYPTDYVSRGKKDMGYMVLASSFSDSAIIADGGDVLQGSPLVRYEIANGIRPFTAASAFNAAGLSIYTPGNHDFNYGYDVLSSFLSGLDADIIAANLIDERDELGVKPYVLKTASDGTRLLFSAVITDYVNIWESRENLAGIRIADSVEAARLALEEGRMLDPDFTILIYHGGFGQEAGPVKENRGDELASLGYDVLLTAHQHAVIEPHMIGNTLVMQAGAKAMHAAHVMLRKGFPMEAEIIDADSSLPLKPAFDSIPDDVEKEVLASLQNRIGTVDGVLLDSSKLESALNGSSLADYFNDVQLAFSGADVSAASLFNEPSSLGPDVTLGGLLSAYPFSNTLLKLRINGRILRLAMEQSASYFDIAGEKPVISRRFTDPKAEHYNYDFYRGISYTYDISKDIGSRVVRLRLWETDLLENPDFCFTIVLNSYRATGTGGYGIYREGEVIERYSQDVQDLLIESFSHPVSIPDKTDFSIIW